MGVPIGNEYLTDIVCECKTKEGTKVWASIRYSEYPNNKLKSFPVIPGGQYTGQYLKYLDQYFKPATYSKNTPLRISGTVSYADSVADDLEKEIGNVLVICVRELEIQNKQ